MISAVTLIIVYNVIIFKRWDRTYKARPAFPQSVCVSKQGKYFSVSVQTPGNELRSGSLFACVTASLISSSLLPSHQRITQAGPEKLRQAVAEAVTLFLSQAACEQN